MIILSNGSVVKLSNGSWLNVQETQNSPEPTPSETPVEEEYCPNCGEVWDGVSCGNCGYPDNMVGDACPNCGESGDNWDGEYCASCGYPDNEDPGDDPDDPGLDDPGDDPGGMEIG